MAYYNTNGLKGKMLSRSIKKTETQDNIRMAFFKKHKTKSWTPHEVWKICFTKSTPITSVRRSISDLTNDEFLVFTKRRVLSPYNGKEGLYKLNTNTI